MEKDKHSRILKIGVILMVAAAILLISRHFVPQYGTGDISRAYLSWGMEADISDDLSYVVINDSAECIYYIDHRDDSVVYILDAADVPVANAYLSDISLDEENNLYVDVVQKNDNSRGNLSEQILVYDGQGNFLRAYKVSEEEGKNGYLRVFGLTAREGYLHFVQVFEDHYAIRKIRIDDGSGETVAEFPFSGNRELINASYDDGNYIVNFSDGCACVAGADGTETQIASFNFHLNDGAAENIYADMYVHMSDGYYFMDKKFFDKIYRLSDGQPEEVYSLSSLYEWEEDWEETDYREYHNNVVDYSLATLEKHGDYLLIVSNANVFISYEGDLEAIYATDEGLGLPAGYMCCNLFRLIAFYLGIGAAAAGVLLCLYYTVQYRFTVLNKTLFWMIPVVILAFVLITIIVVDRSEKIYLEDVKSKLIAASSLLASSLDTDLIRELDSLEDVTNGNAALIREQIRAAVEDNVDWDADIEFNLYAFNSTYCNYILAVYPQEEYEFLNTYFLQSLQQLEADLIGDSHIVYTDTWDQEDVYMDAIVLIYDGEQPIALLDAYMYQEKMNEDIRELQNWIIVTAVIFTLIIVLILVVIARYITSNLEHTSQVVQRISDGDLEARVEKLPKDEIGQVGQGINHMAIQLKQLFDEKEEFALQVIECLVGTIDAKDKYTNGHSLRVAQYSVAIAKKLGKSEEEQRQIYYSGLLHDIGKIGVPDAIINKTSRLTDEEYGTIKTHPEIGYEILSKLSKLENISIGAHSHHERIDGRGYPQGLKGEEIPEMARIIGVADTYDAMTSNRSYRSKLSQEKVRSELENAKGTQLDEKFAQVMLDIDKELFPDGY